jgi:hypothetical protein
MMLRGFWWMEWTGNFDNINDNGNGNFNLKEKENRKKRIEKDFSIQFYKNAVAIL